MIAVRVVLVVMGIVCILSAAPGAVAPWSSIVHWLGVFGLEPIPEQPLVVYCVRLSSLGFALIGVFFLVLATNPVRYGPMVALAVCGLLLMAALALVTGLQIRMQPPWYLADAGLSLLAAVLLLAFWPRGAPVSSVNEM
jgi:hypothetical protein